MNQVPTKALHYITIDGCRFETVLRYNSSTGYIGVTTTRRGNYTAERGKRAEYSISRRNTIPSARYAQNACSKKWRAEHPEYMPEYLEKYNAEHKGEFRIRDHIYYEAHKEHYHSKNVAWRKENKEHLQQYRRDNLREKRDYVLSPPVCIKLNQPSPGDVGHHLMSGVLIYIPEWMNKGTTHNIKTGKGMYDINAQAINHLRSGI